MHCGFYYQPFSNQSSSVSAHRKPGGVVSSQNPNSLGMNLQASEYSQLSAADGYKWVTWRSIHSCNLTCIMQLRLRSTAVNNYWLVLLLSHGNAQGGHCAFLNESLEARSCQKPDTKSSRELLASLPFLTARTGGCHTQKPSYSGSQSIFTCWCLFLFFHLRFLLPQEYNSKP